MGDLLIQLPTDNIPASSEEKEMSDWLFNPTEKLKTGIVSLWGEFQNALLVGVLFAVFSLPPVDQFICNVVPLASKSLLTLILIRTAAFIILYWLLINTNYSAAASTKTTP